MENNITVGIVGLGYVGLPVAVAFSKKYKVIAFDIKIERINNLKLGFDYTGEVESEFLNSKNLSFTSKEEDLKQVDFYIVAVPTPVDEHNTPDLSILLSACEIVGRSLLKGNVVVFESTVYPGASEEQCLPALEKYSGLIGGHDFKIGYSPERINPGDKTHKFEDIVKIISAQDKETLELLNKMYGSVVHAGLFKATSIKVAEAAKVIENTQRDLNIAFVNELSMIFDKMSISTSDVLEAAGTKWNFLKFRPGLVGGHCIGVDPYYLTYKAQSFGYHPQVILAGRSINDGMGKYVAQKCLKEMILAGQKIAGSTVTILGLTFKENVSDLRNSKVLDIISELQELEIKIQICEPIATQEDVLHAFGIKSVPLDELVPASAVIIAVAHEQFKEIKPNDLDKLLQKNGVVIDVKSLLDAFAVKQSGYRYWGL